ncbi:MAG: Calx-beta domain-containing protein, partial [Caldilineaceae bacterium]
GPVPGHRESANIGVWSGIIDTLAPRVTFEYVTSEPLASASATTGNATTVNGGTAQVRCSAVDDHLTETAWLCPVDNSARTEQYQDAPWYTTRLTDTQMVIGFDTLQATVLADPDAGMTACDLYGQCTTCTLTGQCTTFVTEPIRYARTLAIDDVSRAEGDGGTAAFTFAVRLHGDVAGGLTVDYTTVDGSATAPGDYTATNGTLTFAGTDGEIQIISVPVNGDTDFEPDETFSVLLDNLRGGGLNVDIADNTGIGTIEDDDGTSLFIDDVSQVEGASGTTAYDFTVRLRGGIAGGVTVDYTTADGSATAPDDYTATNGTLTFSGVDGETQTITVQVNGDMDVEANETFTVLLSNLQGGEPNIRIGDDTGLGTIENDDGSSLTIDDVSQVEGDSGPTTFVFTVRLSNDVAGGLTVDYSTADGSATAPDDYTATNGTLTFAGSSGETQTITVQVNGDTAAEADESFSVLLRNLQGGGLNVGIADNSGVGTIENDDDGVVVGAENRIFLPVVTNQFDLARVAEGQRDSTTEAAEAAPPEMSTEASPDTTEDASTAPVEGANGVSDETVDLSHQLFLPLISSAE